MAGATFPSLFELSLYAAAQIPQLAETKLPQECDISLAVARALVIQHSINYEGLVRCIELLHHSADAPLMPLLYVIKRAKLRYYLAVRVYMDAPIGDKHERTDVECAMVHAATVASQRGDTHTLARVVAAARQWPTGCPMRGYVLLEVAYAHGRAETARWIVDAFGLTAEYLTDRHVVDTACDRYYCRTYEYTQSDARGGLLLAACNGGDAQIIQHLHSMFNYAYDSFLDDHNTPLIHKSRIPICAAVDRMTALEYVYDTFVVNAEIEYEFMRYVVDSDRICRLVRLVNFVESRPTYDKHASKRYACVMFRISVRSMNIPQAEWILQHYDIDCQDLECRDCLLSLRKYMHTELAKHMARHDLQTAELHNEVELAAWLRKTFSV